MFHQRIATPHAATGHHPGGRLLALGLGALLTALGPSACKMVGPNYTQPTQRMPPAWNSQLSNGLTGDTMTTASLARWWAHFNDPVLDQLIQRALEGNIDLRSAQSAVRQSRSQRAISRSGLFPSLSANGSATRTHSRTKRKVEESDSTFDLSSLGLATGSSGDGSSGGTGTGTGTGTGGTGSGSSGSGSSGDSQTFSFGNTQQSSVVSSTDNVYKVGFDASWEVDVFGGLRREVEAAQHDLEAARAALYDARVSLLAEVALNYTSVRAYQKRIDLAEENLRIQHETLELVQAKLQAEMIDELPVQQARYSYESTAAQIPTLKSGLDEALNRLAVLLGQPPGAVHALLESHQPIPTAVRPVGVGVPSDVLRRRPDIRKAERTLAAQTSRIGVAVADLYPKFTITGSASRQGTGTKGFREYATQGWSIGPNVSWDIFKAGALRENVRLQEELREQDLLTYQSTILTALEDVENKLFSFGQEQERRARLDAAATAAHDALLLSREQYNAGRVDFTDVLTAEQSLVSYQDQLAQSEGDLTTDLISLFKALGGGWTDEPTAENATDAKPTAASSANIPAPPVALPAEAAAPMNIEKSAEGNPHHGQD